MRTVDRFVLAVVVGVGVTALAAHADAQDCTSYYLKVRGQRQGNIAGGVVTRGREGAIRIKRFTHDVVSPRDATSGLPTGRRQHRPLVVTFTADRSVPLLYQALTTNETLTTVTLDCYGRSSSGSEVNIYRMTLLNAHISGLAGRVDVDPATGSGPPILLNFDLSLTYEHITWLWLNPSLDADDDWEIPVAMGPALPARKRGERFA